MSAKTIVTGSYYVWLTYVSDCSNLGKNGHFLPPKRPDLLTQSGLVGQRTCGGIVLQKEHDFTEGAATVRESAPLLMRVLRGQLFFVCTHNNFCHGMLC